MMTHFCPVGATMFCSTGSLETVSMSDTHLIGLFASGLSRVSGDVVSLCLAILSGSLENKCHCQLPLNHFRIHSH